MSNGKSKGKKFLIKIKTILNKTMFNVKYLEIIVPSEVEKTLVIPCDKHDF